jgi:uncharacterized protein with PIN domain
MARLRFLVDEDVDVAVVPVLRVRGHDVVEAREHFGVQTDDKENMQWARTHDAILVTRDKAYVWPRRQSRRSAVLLLRDLYTDQANRVVDLVEVVEREAELAGAEFFMWIGPRDYGVQR